MARRKRTDEPASEAKIADYRYDDSKRKNIPPAGLPGTRSLAFPAGKYKRVAVKVIDPRGNEVLKVHRLGNKEVTYDLR
jgi:hypothetical protein